MTDTQTAHNPERIEVLGIPVHNLTGEQALKNIQYLVSSAQPHQIVTVNSEFVVISQNNPKFKKTLLNADLALADGVGLQIAAFLSGKRFMSRVPGSLLVYELLPLCQENNYKLFFLGAAPGVAEKAAENARAQYPGLQISWSGADPTPEGTKEALEMITNFSPDILLVAYGAPTQDLWISQNRSSLHVPVMMGVGGTLDFLAGVASRPPHFVHQVGLEWLYRLIKQPWRWRRQLRLPVFLYLVFAERLKSLLSGKSEAPAR